MASKEELAGLVDAGITAWNNQDTEAFVALFTDDFQWRDATVPEPITDATGAADYMRAWFTAFPDLVSSARNLVIGDDAVAAELSFTGTHTGPLAMGGSELPATGKSVTAGGSFFIHARGGKVAEFATYPDVAGMLMQLGVLGAQPSEAATPQ